MTDWYNEVSGKSDTAKTDWYGELTSPKFKELSQRQPYTVKEPGEIDRKSDVPLTPDEQERLYVVDNPKYGATAGTHFKAGFADNVDTMIRTAAQARFPDLPPEDAVKRYGVVSGDIVYVGDDGKLYKEFPTGDWSPTSVGRGFAGAVGPAIPKTAGAMVGVATAPMLLTGPVGAAASVGLTSAAQAGGEAIRQGVGQLMLDEPVDAGQIASEGAEGAASQMVAGAITGAMSRGAARDIMRLDRPAAEALKAKAERSGIPLTPAETTNLPSLRAQQKALSNLPRSADTMDDFYRARGETVSRAVGNTLDDISRDQGGDVAGKVVRDASGKIVDQMTALRAQQAKPLYEAAFKSGKPVDTKPVLEYINTELEKGARGGIRTALERSREALKIPGTQNLDKTIQGLHNAKLEIDNMISKANTDTSLGSVAKAKLVEVQKRLVAQLEASSKDYANARKLYADVSPGIDKVREGVIGVLSELGDDQLYKAGRVMLDPSRVSPQVVREARATFLGAGKEAEWNALLRSYLQEHFEVAGREYSTTGGIATQGAKFRASMIGNPKQREILKAAMKPEQWGSFSDLMEVLEATGRAMKTGSDTAWNQEAMKEMRRISGGVSRNLVAPHQIPGRLRDWWEQVKLGNYSEKLAQVITSPDGMNKLKELRQVSPRGARAAVITANALGLLTEEVLESETGETRLPEIYEAGGATR